MNLIQEQRHARGKSPLEWRGGLGRECYCYIKSTNASLVRLSLILGWYLKGLMVCMIRIFFPADVINKFLINKFRGEILKYKILPKKLL